MRERAALTTRLSSCFMGTHGPVVGAYCDCLAWNCTDATDETDAFRKMLPLAKASNARLVLANRRDYTAATPPGSVWACLLPLQWLRPSRMRLDRRPSRGCRTAPERRTTCSSTSWQSTRSPLVHPDAKTGGITVGG